MMKSGETCLSILCRKWISTRWRARTCPSHPTSACRSRGTITSMRWSPTSTSSSPSVTRRPASPQVRASRSTSPSRHLKRLSDARVPPSVRPWTQHVAKWILDNDNAVDALNHHIDVECPGGRWLRYYRNNVLYFGREMVQHTQHIKF